MTDEKFFEMIQKNAEVFAQKEAFVEEIVLELIGDQLKESESFFLKHFAELSFFLGHLTNLSRLELPPIFKVGAQYDSEGSTYAVSLFVSPNGGGFTTHNTKVMHL